MQRFTYVLFALLALLVLVLPTQARVTNAQRLARHQPPLRPAGLVKRVGPSATPVKRVYPSGYEKRAEPSATIPVKRSEPSSTASVMSGRIQARDYAGKTIGYIWNNATGPDGLQLDPNGEDLVVRFISGKLQAINALFPGPFIGISDLDVSTASALIAPLAGVTEDVTSTIWSLDYSTGRLTAIYNGTSASVTWDVDTNKLTFAANAPSGQAVTLFLVK
ncbi:hypothetical protein OF83DRAFT_1174198 [Amylostereum chailletii]|nr:hypothetical protein OF83DRAFT_1174198 [Amylostereum chailletii]